MRLRKICAETLCKNESLRTTVPRSIIKQFGLTQDDQLEWNLLAEGGELIIKVKPIKVQK